MPNVTDKYTPTYNLDSFKTSDYTVKKSALLGAAAMGFDLSDMTKAIGSMLPEHFYKSMTSYNNHRIWQDVYHVPYKNFIIYIKFTLGTVTEFDLLSFKEK